MCGVQPQALDGSGGTLGQSLVGGDKDSSEHKAGTGCRTLEGDHIQGGPCLAGGGGEVEPVGALSRGETIQERGDMASGTMTVKG